MDRQECIKAINALPDKKLMSLVLLDNKAWGYVVASRRLEAAAEQRDRAIFRAMHELFMDEQPIDMITVHEHLAHSGELGKNELTDEYLLSLTESFPEMPEECCRLDAAPAIVSLSEKERLQLAQCVVNDAAGTLSNPAWMESDDSIPKLRQRVEAAQALLARAIELTREP